MTLFFKKFNLATSLMDVRSYNASAWAAADSKAVFLIMDPLFGSKLFSLPENAPAWLIDSPENRQAAGAASFHTDKRDQYTTFTHFPSWDEAEFLASFLVTIGDHHSPSTSWGEYAQLIVVGLSATPPIREVIAERGLLLRSVFDTGFAAQRTA